LDNCAKKEYHFHANKPSFRGARKKTKPSRIKMHQNCLECRIHLGVATRNRTQFSETLITLSFSLSLSLLLQQTTKGPEGSLISAPSSYHLPPISPKLSHSSLSHLSFTSFLCNHGRFFFSHLRYISQSLLNQDQTVLLILPFLQLDLIFQPGFFFFFWVFCRKWSGVEPIPAER